MHIGPTFIAHTQPAELVQPGECALDHPARQAQMAAVPSEAFADTRNRYGRYGTAWPARRDVACPRLLTFCQLRPWRQHAMLKLHPISYGSSFQGNPDCRMNRRPVKTCRSSSRLRLAGILCSGGGGSNRRTVPHNSSLTSLRAMLPLYRTYWKGDWTAITGFFRCS